MVIALRIFLALLIGLTSSGGQAQNRFITVASTTSTEQSGLFGFLLPIFEKEKNIQVRVVAVGTGQALDLARRGEFVPPRPTTFSDANQSLVREPRRA